TIRTEAKTTAAVDTPGRRRRGMRCIRKRTPCWKTKSRGRTRPIVIFTKGTVKLIPETQIDVRFSLLLPSLVWQVLKFISIRLGRNLMSREVFILGGKRTAMGEYVGALK